MMKFETLEEKFESEWGKYQAAASKSKSQDLKRALRDDGE